MKTLEILYRDQYIIAINKPAGMLVHPGREPEPSENIAMKVLRDQIGMRVCTIHRLDRPTSGVLLFGLSSDIETNVRKQFERHEVRKIYDAVVIGRTDGDWTSLEPIQKDETKAFCEAETHFVRNGVCEIEPDQFSHLTVVPKSGRYHQIRKHLSMAGYPIVGDYLYGEPEEMDRIAVLTGQPRLMLHARSLQLEHPITNEAIVISAPLPERFSPFWDGLG